MVRLAVFTGSCDEQGTIAGVVLKHRGLLPVPLIKVKLFWSLRGNPLCMDTPKWVRDVGANESWWVRPVGMVIRV